MGKYVFLYKVNLEDQRKATDEFKEIIVTLRVKNSGSSRRQKKRVYFNVIQQWQHGIIISSNANSMLFDTLKAKYDIDYTRTYKFNSVNWLFSISLKKQLNSQFP